jgi:predicted RNase H-like HicB family nuclease
MKGTDIHRQWGLARQVAPRKTIVFLVTVEIEKTDTDCFASTILPLDSVFASGTTPDEAERNALELFQDMVDHCIESGNLDEFLGDAKITEQVDASVDQIMDAIESMSVQQGNGSHLHADHGRKLPPPWMLTRTRREETDSHIDE